MAQRRQLRGGGEMREGVDGRAAQVFVQIIGASVVMMGGMGSRDRWISGGTCVSSGGGAGANGRCLVAAVRLGEAREVGMVIFCPRPRMAKMLLFHGLSLSLPSSRCPSFSFCPHLLAWSRRLQSVSHSSKGEALAQ